MTTKLPLIACSLDAGGQRERLTEWRTLVGRASARVETDRGVRYTFPAELQPQIGELAAAEHECCPWLEFEVARAGHFVELSVAAPPHAQEALRFVFA